MGEHCWKPVLCFPLGYNHDPDGVVSDEFRYGCSYKAKRGKCIYFRSFLTKIKSIHCNAICIWNARDIFVYQFVETGGKQIDLWIKLKPVTQNFKQFVGEHPFCVAIEDSRHFVCHCVLYTRNVAWRNPNPIQSLFCADSHISFAISLQITECMPPTLLMYSNAVLLSVKISTCLTLHLCLKYDFRANKMAFSSKTLIWFISKELHLPPIGVFPSVAPHPCSLASAWIVHSIGTSCND